MEEGSLILTQQEKLHAFMKARTTMFFSSSFLNVLQALDTGASVPGSIRIGDLSIPVIGVKLSVHDLDFYGIRKGPSNEMETRFRYLDNADCDELLEICLYFKRERIMAFDYDPLFPNIRRWLKDVIEAKLFGFCFYCRELKQFISSFTSPNEEDERWLKRNSKRMEFLDENDFERILNSSRAHDSTTLKSVKRYFIGQNHDEEACFINETSTLIALEDIKNYFGKVPADERNSK